MRTRLTSVATVLCLIVFVADVSFAQSYSGTYTVANQQGGAITLTLQQDAQNALVGTMSGNGVQYQVEGIVEEGIAMGAIYNQEGGVLFEAQLQGSQLLLSLFEVGPDNEPDYANPTELILTRQGATAGPIPQQQPTAPLPVAPPSAGNPLGGGAGFAGSFAGEGIALRCSRGRTATRLAVLSRARTIRSRRPRRLVDSRAPSAWAARPMPSRPRSRGMISR